MDFFKKFDARPKNVLKMVGLLFGAIFLLAFVVSIGTSTIRGIGNRAPQISVAPSMGVGGGMYTYGQDGYADKEIAYSAGDMATLSVRNTLPVMPPVYNGTVGNTAEAFEVTDYTATIETRNREQTCKEIVGLKSLKYVIFENSNESDTQCNYRFKVEKGRVTEILALIKALDPKDISENTYTIKEQVDDFTGRLEILQNKKNSIDETLKNALSAYTEITRLAIDNQDTASLAKIIDSKIQIIERLTNESIAIAEQIEYLTRAKEGQLDRLYYTYFNVYAYEDTFIDGSALADSWKYALKNFFFKVNTAVQDATINVIAFVFLLIPYLIYLLIVLVVIKYVWRIGRHIWKK